jgi:hypothetical protein
MSRAGSLAVDEQDEPELACTAKPATSSSGPSAIADNPAATATRTISGRARRRVGADETAIARQRMSSCRE